MSPRPDRLSYSAYRIVKASRELSSGQKLVWGELHALDQGPDGAWLGAGPLADRLGMGRDNVEKHRRELLRLGLLERRDRGRGRSDSWYPTLSPECIPPRRPTPQQVHELAERLDRHTIAMREGSASGAPEESRHRRRSSRGEGPRRLSAEDLDQVIDRGDTDGVT